MDNTPVSGYFLIWCSTVNGPLRKPEMAKFIGKRIHYKSPVNEFVSSVNRIFYKKQFCWTQSMHLCLWAEGHFLIDITKEVPIARLRNRPSTFIQIIKYLR